MRLADCSFIDNKENVIITGATRVGKSYLVYNFEIKTNSYKNIFLSSISFMMLYRDVLIGYYAKHNKRPHNNNT